MNPQLQGLEHLQGTYVFDIKTAYRTRHINRFFWNMIHQDWRQCFNEDAETLMTQAQLSEHEKQLVRTQDWIGLIHHGANFFVLEKFARVVGKTNLEVYAAMRGESYEAFMQTRKVPEAT